MKQGPPQVFFASAIWEEKPKQWLFLTTNFRELHSLKLTKIWYRVTLLYPYLKFNIYFPKIFVIQIFLGTFDTKIEISPN